MSAVLIVAWLNGAGLIANILGVVMVFFYGFPQPEHDFQGGLALEDGNIAEDGRTYGQVRRSAQATKLKYVSISKAGLIFMLMGFVLQLLATWYGAKFV